MKYFEFHSTFPSPRHKASFLPSWLIGKVFLSLLLFVNAPVAFAQEDSIAVPEREQTFKPKQLIAPAVLLTYGVAECTVRALAETLAGLNTPNGILPVGIGDFPRGTGKEGF